MKIAPDLAQKPPSGGHSTRIHVEPNPRAAALQAFLDEARKRMTNTAVTDTEPGVNPSHQNYGRNFENYARNFENYARNFENYARNFANYARGDLRAVHIAAVPPMPSLPNGKPVPDRIANDSEQNETNT